MSSKGVQKLEKLGYFHRGKSVVLIKQLPTFHRFFLGNIGWIDMKGKKSISRLQKQRG